MNKSTRATAAELRTKLTKLGVSFKRKAPRAELLALLAAAHQTQQSAAPKKAAKPRNSVKEVIRARFPNVGDKVAAATLLAALKSVKEATIATMLSDLRNKKYCGAAGVIDVRKVGDDFERLA